MLYFLSEVEEDWARSELLDSRMTRRGQNAHSAKSNLK